jgi:hypothetical protein
MSQLKAILRNDLGVKEAYRHGAKEVTPGEPISLNGTILKWYRLYSHEEGVGAPSRIPEIEQLARSYLERHSLEAKGLGFVILHQCGTQFYFLIVNTWRGNNELWETVFYKDGDSMADFALWPRDSMHKPAFCVWELMPVWHETKSWERFLVSGRDEAAARAWLDDLYAGAA